MAIDTRDKRASALREGLLPLPDGAPLDQGDRQQVLWQYRGIGAEPPSPFGGGGQPFIGVIQQVSQAGIMNTSMGQG